MGHIMVIVAIKGLLITVDSTTPFKELLSFTSTVLSFSILLVIETSWMLISVFHDVSPLSVVWLEQGKIVAFLNMLCCLEGSLIVWNILMMDDFFTTVESTMIDMVFVAMLIGPKELSICGRITVLVRLLDAVGVIFHLVVRHSAVINEP